MRFSNTLLLGIGNTLLTDEGAGIHALHLFQNLHTQLEHITFVDGGTLSFTLAAYIEDCDNLVVFDAAEFHAAPGTVKSLAGMDMDRFLGAARRSPHEVGLLDLFDIARLTDALPVNRALIGIQPGSLDWGMSPTTAVEGALTTAVDAALELLNQWGQLPDGYPTAARPTGRDRQSAIMAGV